MLPAIKEHLERVKNAVSGVYGLANLADFIEKKTYLEGKPFSFKDHEFQRDILADPSRTTITVKIAQVGLSEIAYRWSLAACHNIEDFTVIYTFPNAGDAGSFCKTRIDPIIAGSPELQRSLNINLNNSEIKQFGRNSFLYMKGTRSEAGAISVPADAIVHDEWDKSDIAIATMYIARLQHKPHKIRKLFSTPTVNKYGILLESETARRYRHMQMCNKCNHRWLPDYFEDVKIPGYNGKLDEITKSNIKNYRWKEAFLACPRCGRDPELHYSRMEWVVENPNEAYEPHAYFVSPFSAPKIITPSYLVNVSTQYKRYSEFKNQGLGLAAEESDSAILEEDLEKALIQAELMDGSLHVFAADMGLTCHIMIGRRTPDDTVLVVHKEKVPYYKFMDRRRELCIKYRVKMSNHDSQPYVDMIRTITEADPNAYGSYFVTSKTLPAFSIREQEEEPDEGKIAFRVIRINRTPGLDEVLELFKKGKIVVQKCALDDEFKAQMQSLKRIQKFDKDQEMYYHWEKTGEGDDHFHFALLYLVAALTLQGVAAATNSPAAGFPLVKVIRGPAR